MRPFVQHTGPTVSLPHNPLEVFGLFFTPAIMLHMVSETNRYAALCLQSTNEQWSTNEDELRAYLGFCILMGIVREPEIRDYWSHDELLHYKPIAERISRKRFEEISRYLHFADNATLPQRGQPGFHRLQKVKGAIGHGTRTLHSHLQPEQLSFCR